MAEYTVTDNIRWRIEDGTLMIEPDKDGAMIDYVQNNICFSPWYAQRDKITDVEILDGITKIGAGAFYDCYKLQRISISNTVESVGFQAFHNCSMLKVLTFPESVKTIGDYAFTFCASLTRVEFRTQEPISVGKCVFETFAGSENIITIDGLGVDSTVFDEGNIGANAKITFETDGKDGNIRWAISGGNLRLTMSKDYSDEYKPYVKDNVCSAHWHKYRTGIHRATLNDGFKEINCGMFFDCVYLTDVKIPPTIEVIGMQAFHNCRSLKSLTVPQQVRIIFDYAFTFCTSLEILYMLPEKPPMLGKHLFDTVPGAKIITIKGQDWINYEYFNDETIGDNAKISFDVFGYMESLEWRIENGVLTIRGIAGSNMQMDIMVVDNKCIAPWHKYASGIHHIVIEPGMLNIGAGAFYDCPYAEDIQIPSTITDVGYQAFHNCKKLHNITFPANLRTIGDYEFTFCTSLKSIYFMSDSSPYFGIGIFDGIPEDQEITIYTIGWKPQNASIQSYPMIKFAKIGE